jgi:hypothetical protein
MQYPLPKYGPRNLDVAMHAALVEGGFVGDAALGGALTRFVGLTFK